MTVTLDDRDIAAIIRAERAPLEAENAKLRAALKTIREAAVSGHINYMPVREFIDRELEE